MQDMEKSKRRISFMINDNVSITGEDKDNQVVMREELTDDELDLVNGGVSSYEECSYLKCDKKDLLGSNAEESEDFFSSGFMGMCSGYEQESNLIQHNENEGGDPVNEIREDCFAYGFMGMCSGYEQQSSLVQDQGSEAQNAIDQTNTVEDCITYGFMGMCSGYELAGVSEDVNGK